MAFVPYADVPTALANPAFIVPMPQDTAMLVFDGSVLFELNLVSAFIWDLLDGTRSVEDIVSAMASRFRVDRRTARRDVERLCQVAVRQGLIGC
jgi:hypothetical protein